MIHSKHCAFCDAPFESKNPTAKFCCKPCSNKAAKGRSLPHTKEWEERRLAAVRATCASKIHPRGYKRPREHVEPMIRALSEARAKNPSYYAKLAAANLPKETTGSDNGNWKGGITVKTRGVRFSKEYRDWRRLVIRRDQGKCRICGTTENIQVHHIIAMSECPAIAFLPMNGVCLCKTHHFEMDEVWRGKRFKKKPTTGTSLAMVFTIPHVLQAYPTVGNWQALPGGTPVVFVSKMSDPRYELLVAIHELIEFFLCRHNKVSQQSVDDFDVKFENARQPGNTDEPGDDPNAPYRLQHCIATGVERVLAALLGVSWKAYEEEINSL